MPVLAAVLLCGGIHAEEPYVYAGRGDDPLSSMSLYTMLEVGGMPATRFVVEGLLGTGVDWSFLNILVVVPPGCHEDAD